MNIIIGIFIVAIIAGIIFLNRSELNPEDRRKKFVQDLSTLVGGKLEPLTEGSDSFRLTFKYNDAEFEFIDHMDVTLGVKAYRDVSLRVSSGELFDLTFSEKTRGLLTRIQTVSDVEQRWDMHPELVYLPRDFDDFTLYTNAPKLADLLFKDKRFVKELTRYKSRDARGQAVMSIEIYRGAIILHFHTGGALVPDIFDLENNLSAIEGYIRSLLVFQEKIRAYALDT